MENRSRSGEQNGAEEGKGRAGRGRGGGGSIVLWGPDGGRRRRGASVGFFFVLRSCTASQINLRCLET